MSFPHLHVHSTASDGLATPTALAQAAAQMGAPILALTDHDTVAGHAEFLTACARLRLAPVLGAELSITHAGLRGHALVVARTPLEYQRLRRVLKASHPRRRPALASLRGCGLVSTSCLGGLPATLLRRQDFWAAHDLVAELATLFGADLAVEVQPSFGVHLGWLLAIAGDVGVATLATNDVHYVAAADAARHRNVGLHLASAAEMRAASVHPGWRAALAATYHLAATLRWQPHDVA